MFHAPDWAVIKWPALETFPLGDHLVETATDPPTHQETDPSRNIQALLRDRKFRSAFLLSRSLEK